MSREVARWTREGSSREAGCIEYEDGSLFVHNDNAPTRGNNSVWDLVRKEKFLELDRDTPPETPIAERPSQLAMIAFANELPEIRAARAAEEFSDLGALPEQQAKARQEAALKRERFQVITCEQLERQPSLDYIIKGVLLRTAFAGILGAPGDGKTLLAIDLGCAMASGTDWHGFKVAGKLRVVHVFAEGAAGAKDRALAARKHRGLSVASMPEFILDTPDIKDEEQARLLAQKIGKADVIFIDTFAATLSGSENEGKDVQPYITNCNLLHQLTGALVCILCHPGKDASKKLRGWSGTLGALDTLIEIERTGDYRAVRVLKQKDSSEGPLLGFTVKTVEVGRDRDGDPQHGAVIEIAHAPAKKAANAERTRSGKNVDAVRRHVHATGGREFNVAELTATVAATLPKTSKKDRRTGDVGRAIKSLTGDFFEVVPESDGERVRLRGPLVDNDPAAWLSQ